MMRWAVCFLFFFYSSFFFYFSGVNEVLFLRSCSVLSLSLVSSSPRQPQTPSLSVTFFPENIASTCASDYLFLDTFSYSSLPCLVVLYLPRQPIRVLFHPPLSLGYSIPPVARSGRRSRSITQIPDP